MLVQVLVGSLAFSMCVIIHAAGMVFVASRLAPLLRRNGKALSVWKIMICVVFVLSIFHSAEILVWSVVINLVGAVSRIDEALYFAFTSYTTLGYGDVLANKGWLLLGPASAMNGILMFGWSTAVIYQAMGEAFRMKDR